MIEDGLAAFASSFQYCEPVGFGFVKQPINVIGNLGFLATFFYSWYYIGLRHLTLGALLIFIGSTIWHAGLHPFGLIIDILPIILWLVFFIWAVTKYHLKPIQRMIVIALFLCGLLSANNLFATVFPMNSGIFVALTLLAFVFGVLSYNYDRHISYLMIYTCFLMNIAIIARMADIPFCERFSIQGYMIGTHWIWHLFASISMMPLIKLIHHLDKTHAHKVNNRFYITHI